MSSPTPAPTGPRPAREVRIECAALPEAVDELRRAAEYDMATGRPGTLSMRGWSQRCMIPESETRVWRPGIVCVELTAALLDGVWRRVTSRHFMPLDLPLDTGEGKGYPHGYPHAYGVVATPTSLHQPGYLPAPIRLTIFGPASNPSVTIGDNTYRYEGDVPSGGRLVLDGAELTATLVNVNGSSVNAMPGAVIGGGEGSGTYAFERVAPGYNALAWNGAFGFDADLIEEEGEPPWSS